MFDSAVLEVAIGLTVIYIVFSLACTVVNEFIANLLNLRAKRLEKGVLSLFVPQTEKDFSTDLYNHPLIKSIAETTGKPSYIPANTFVTALLDRVANPRRKDTNAKAPSQPLPTTQYEMLKMMDELPNEVKSVLSPLVQTAGADMDKVRANLERWYDTAMERVSGEYKRYTHKVIFVIALVLVLASNADTIMLANRFWKDPTVRKTLVAQAAQIRPISEKSGTGKQTSQKETGASGADVALKTATDTIKPLLGWTGEKMNHLECYNKILGLLLTAFAASLGAPFWFDVLSKIKSLRYSGEKVGKSDVSP